MELQNIWEIWERFEKSSVTFAEIDFQGMTKLLLEKGKDNVLGQIPFREPGRPEDVAGVVSFLAGDDGRYITGQVICVDGGMAI